MKKKSNKHFFVTVYRFLFYHLVLQIIIARRDEFQ